MENIGQGPHPPTSPNSWPNNINANHMFNNVNPGESIDFVGGGQTILHFVSIVLKNPLPPLPLGGPPAPEFAPATRARLLRLLEADRRIIGTHEHILHGVAEMIVICFPYLIQEDVITIPETDQVYITLYDDEISFANATREDHWAHAELPVEIVDEEMTEEGEMICFDGSSEEGYVYSTEPRTFDEIMAAAYDHMTLEDLLQIEAVYGLPEFVVRRELKSEEFKLPPDTTIYEDPCCICVGPLEDGDMTGKLLCRHKFHYDCIGEWLTKRNMCPLCRRTGIYP